MRIRIATPVCGLVRNDMGFVTICIKLGAESVFFAVIARRDVLHPDVAIRFPIYFKLQGTSKNSAKTRHMIVRVPIQ